MIYILRQVVSMWGVSSGFHSDMLVCFSRPATTSYHESVERSLHHHAFLCSSVSWVSSTSVWVHNCSGCSIVVRECPVFVIRGSCLEYSTVFDCLWVTQFCLCICRSQRLRLSWVETVGETVVGMEQAWRGASLHRSIFSFFFIYIYIHQFVHI